MKLDDQLLKFEIVDGSVICKINIEDLVWAFEHNINSNPDNMPKIVKGKEKEFAKYVIEYLMDEDKNNGNNTNWSTPFENCFEEILESAEEFYIEPYDED